MISVKLRNIRGIVSLALVLSTISVVSAYASPTDKQSTNTVSTIGGSVVIDKSESEGGSTLLPLDMLGKMSETKSSKAISPDTPVPINKGSIKITLPDTSKKDDKGNVKFSLSKVSNVVDGEYKLMDNYKSSGVDLNKIKNSNDLEIAASMLNKVSSSGTSLSTDSNGVCSKGDLDVGVYLVHATDIAKYENITPFIVSIPVWNESSKTMSFDVKVIPKHTPLPVKELSKYRAPYTGNSDREVYAVLAGISLISGTGLLVLRKKGE